MPSEPGATPGSLPAGDVQRHLPRIALLFALLASVKRYALPLLAVIFFSRGNGYETWLVFFLVPSFGYALVNYLTFTYHLGHDELVIRSGLFSRQERHIPYARIQNVDLRQNPLHRLAKVATVRLETGSGSDAEAEIEVLTEAAIAELRAAVFRRDTARQAAALLAARAAAETPAAGEAARDASPADLPAALPAAPGPLLELGPADLVLRGLLTGRGFILVAAAFGFLQQSDLLDFGDQFGRLAGGLGFDRGHVEAVARGERELAGGFAGGADFGPAVWLRSVLTPHNLALGALVGAALLVATRLLSILWTLATFWGFRLTRRGESLSTEQGLFTRVSATLPRHRIQALELRRGFLDGLFGRAAVIAATAGRGITGEGQPKNPSAENAELFLAPILRAGAAETLMRGLAPEYFEDGLAWRGLAAGTFKRLARKRLMLLTPFAVLAFWLLGPLGLLAMTALGAYQVVALHRFVARSRWALGRHALFWRTGSFGEVSKMVPFEKIQVVVLDSSPFDRRRGTAHLRVDTAATDTGETTLHLPYLDAGDASELAARLERETGRRRFRW